MKASPEFLPIIEWWEKDGKQFVTYLLIAAVVVGGYHAWKNHRAASRQAAVERLVSAYTTDELEEAVSRYSGTPTVGSLRLRLAKSYFDGGRYEEALDAYTACEGCAPEGFADVPVVGKAQCLEALGRFDEAAAAFDAFAEANANHYLTLTAQLGAARCLVQAGDRDKALTRIAALRETCKDDEMAIVRIDATEDCVKRFEKRETKSLFDAADAAAKALGETAPAATTNVVEKAE